MVWDPFTQNEIDKIERLQRQAARFINNHYKSREENVKLKDLDLPRSTLQQQRKGLTTTTPSCSGPIPAQKSQASLEPGAVFSRLMLEMDFNYFHRFRRETIH